VRALSPTSNRMSSRVTEMPAGAHGPLGHATRGASALVGAAFATAAAWAAFSRMPAMPVRVGHVVLETTVPLGYQLSVFPAFGAFLAVLALDVARGDDRRTWLPRALLLASTGLLATARLLGALPLSGHGIFLFAALAYELAPPPSRDAQDSHVSMALAIPGLLVVGWCKLVVWGDPVWLGASAALGAVIGLALARIARA
jgi:hypothetical protein